MALAKQLKVPLIILACLGLAQGARAQSLPPSFGTPPPAGAASSTTTAQNSFGNPLSLDKGPWVLGEVLFLSAGRMVSDYTWRDKVRGARGSLYTKSDIMADVGSLMSLGKFDKVEPAVYEIPGSPVPKELFSVASSTSEVRLIFTVTEKPAAAVPAGPAKRLTPPAAVSGMIMTPTAYRGLGKYNTPGLGLDVNAVYLIGRLYGRNDFANAPAKTNYLDRVGIWLLTADGKMQLQSEGTFRPAFAVGGQGTFLFRDSPQPKVNDPNPTVTVNATQKTTKLLSDTYVVMSKKFGPVRTSAGFMQGSAGDAVASFSEFLSPDAVRFFAGRPGGTIVSSRSMPFASLFMLPRPEYPLGVEVIKFNGAALNPILFNFKVGYFLHMNFDVGYLKFQGGYDILGLLQFRYNHFPRR